MTTDTVQDEWALSSGLALDGANAEITGFEFGYNANIGAGIVCANITFTPLEGGEDIEQSFSVGKGWDASRDGSELVPESGKNRPINKSTNFGRLIESAVACLDGDGSKLGGTPKQAGTWIGSRWEVGTVQIETTNPTTQVTKTKDAFVFVDFLGSSEGEAKAAAPTKAPAKKAATGAKTTTPTVPDGIDESLWTTLVELAGTHDEHDAFVDAALDIAEVESNKAAQKAVMGTKAGSVWAAKVAA